MNGVCAILHCANTTTYKDITGNYFPNGNYVATLVNETY